MTSAPPPNTAQHSIWQLEPFLHTGPSVAFLWELRDDWPVTYVSENIVRFGYQSASFQAGGLPMTRIIHPDDWDRVAFEVTSNLARGNSCFDQRFRIRTGNGQTRWVSQWAQVWRDGNDIPTHTQAIVQDITDSVVLEERNLRLMKERGSLFVDLNEDSTIRVVNDHTLAVLEMDEKDVVGRKWFDLMRPESRRRESRERLRNILAGLMCPTGEHEVELYSTTGRRHVVRWRHTLERDANGKVCGLFAFGSDLTEQRRQEKCANDMANMVMENPNPVLRIDTDGDIILANTAAVALIDAFIDHDDCRRDWLALLARAQSSTDGVQTEITLEDRSYLFNILPQPEHGYINLYAVDVTDRVKACENLTGTLKNTIYVLSSVLEARDPYTAGHEKRVAELAVKIGRRMGLDQNRLDGLELAALIHDIGKIQVPAEILAKPSRLSHAEYEIIKLHPEVGAGFIRGLTFDWPIADIVEQHHERYDGSGYPKGLAGEHIIQEARIIAVADTLEAMASHRPYRPGLGLDRAAEEIRSGAGTRYDPVVARTCLSLIESGEIVL